MGGWEGVGGASCARMAAAIADPTFPRLPSVGGADGLFGWLRVAPPLPAPPSSSSPPPPLPLPPPLPHRRPSIRLSSSASIFLCRVRVLLHHLSFWGATCLHIAASYSAFALRFSHLPALSRLAALVLFVHLGDFCRTAAALRNFASPYFVLCGILKFFFFFSHLFFGHQSRVAPSQVSRLSLPPGFLLMGVALKHCFSCPH